MSRYFVLYEVSIGPALPCKYMVRQRNAGRFRYGKLLSHVDSAVSVDKIHCFDNLGLAYDCQQRLNDQIRSGRPDRIEKIIDWLFSLISR